MQPNVNLLRIGEGSPRRTIWVEHGPRNPTPPHTIRASSLTASERPSVPRDVSSSHPNILAIFDFGTHGGTAFLVAELLEGETLRARLTRGELPIAKALDQARQIAQGLAEASLLVRQGSHILCNP